MELSPTHSSLIDGKNTQVTAWRNGSHYIPVWVARRFHSTGGPELKAIAAGGLLTLRIGEWAVTDGVTEIVLTDSEFNAMFHPL